MCFSTYSEARARIRDKLKHRGFWPPRGAKGKAKGARKGGRFDFMPKKKRETLAERIANSTCRRCGQKGHWKLECPQRNMDKEEIHHITEEMSEEPEQEILSHLPANVSPMVTIEEMFKKADSQDSKFEKQSPPIFQVFSKVNEEFIESAMTLTSDRSKLNGRSLGNMLCGAISRKADTGRTERREVVFVVETGCPGIIDTGASKTVIGQGKVRELLKSLPSWIQKQVSWKKSETIFRFGNNAVLPSIGAVYIPFGSRWLKIEVVSGETPFLLSNSFLKAIDADVCTNKSCLRLNQCDMEIPL